MPLASTCTCTPDQFTTTDEVAYRLLHYAYTCTCIREQFSTTDEVAYRLLHGTPWAGKGMGHMRPGTKKRIAALCAIAYDQGHPLCPTAVIVCCLLVQYQYQQCIKWMGAAQ